MGVLCVGYSAALRYSKDLEVHLRLKRSVVTGAPIGVPDHACLLVLDSNGIGEGVICGLHADGEKHGGSHLIWSVLRRRAVSRLDLEVFELVEDSS